ncbi:MAG: hypothetical protein ABW003_16290, partial [Microvirga sp.]
MNPTGLTPRFQLLFQESAPGSRFNEDGLGHRGRFAWIIDGATGLSSEPMTPGPTDAAWLAGQMGEKLAELTGRDGELGDLLARLDDTLQGTFSDATAYIETIHDN